MSSRLILIDSPPNGGMRSLRHALEDVLDGGFAVTHIDGEPEGWKYLDAIKPALLGRSNVVLEGSWYPHVHHMAGAEVQMLERAALTCGKTHIVCRPSRYTGEMGPLQLMDVLLSDDYNRVEFDTNSNLHGDVEGFVRRCVLPIMDQAPIAPEPYVGKYAERAIVIVCDKPSFKGFAPPFISFRPDGVSWWLADGMRRAGLLEEYFLWVNCQDSEDNPTSPDPLVGAEIGVDRRAGGLKYHRVFALGDNAAAWCRKWGIEFTAHKHPLAWKRYHPGKEYPLVVDLVKTVGGMK
jgi:hypothetical protein